MAHSSPREGQPADPYARHVLAVLAGARERAERMLRHATTPVGGLLDAVVAAAAFHDLGKLDPDVQKALQGGKLLCAIYTLSSPVPGSGQRKGSYMVWFPLE